MRKISVVGADEPVKNFMTRRSVIGTMDKFVQAVDTMNETVMVPSLLMDLSFNAEQTGSADMHSFYSLLNSVKQELLYGCGNNNNNNMIDKEPTIVELGRRPLVRRMSSSSLASSEISETDFYPESFVSESEFSSLDSEEVACSRVTSDFQHHLNGLCRTLKLLTHSAHTLTSRYKTEVEVERVSG
ncbi:hypothetical protein CHUAL_013703 [Chamberlinius hualienensis]